MIRFDFREEAAFTRQIPDLFGTDNNYSAFQTLLNENPRKGDVIPDSGGIRKIRYRDITRGKGQRGGVRIIYLFIEQYELILLIRGYNKNIPDLTPAQRAVVKQLAEDFTEQVRVERDLLKRQRERQTW